MIGGIFFNVSEGERRTGFGSTVSMAKKGESESWPGTVGWIVALGSAGLNIPKVTSVKSIES